MSNKKVIQATKNYKLFHMSDDNRPVDIAKHNKLKKSMQESGYIKGYPIIVKRDDKGRLVVKDGQHRLSVAELLQIPVWWVEDDGDFDIATVNSTHVKWQPVDYAKKWAANGKKDYQEAIEFCEQYNLPISRGFSLLAGSICTAGTGFRDAYANGSFRIREKSYAHIIASVYRTFLDMKVSVNKSRLLEALILVCRVDGFDKSRLIDGAKKTVEKFQNYSTCEAYMDMLEDMYNFRRSKLVSIKNEAIVIERRIKKQNLEKFKNSNLKKPLTVATL